MKFEPSIRHDSELEHLLHPFAEDNPRRDQTGDRVPEPEVSLLLQTRHLPSCASLPRRNALILVPEHAI